MEKTSTKETGIKAGDTIRFEPEDGYGYVYKALEYLAVRDGHIWSYDGEHYLVERPEPQLEPHWGMVIGDPAYYTERAVFVPAYNNDREPWITSELDDDNWKSHDWAKQKLAGGWTVIEKPENVK